MPWSVAPPFEFTAKKNLSLEIYAHSEHKHMPKLWANSWVLHSGERIRASEQFKLESGVFRIRQCFVDRDGSTLYDNERDRLDTLGYSHPNLPK